MNKIRNSLHTLRRQMGWTPLRVAARLTIACLLLFFLGSSKLATIGWANGGTTVSIAPASQEVLPEDTAATEVLVKDVTGLYGFEFQITFAPTVLEVVDADPDGPGVQIQPGGFLSPDWLLDNTVNNDTGTIAFALCQMNPSEPQSGDGVLATITWRGKAEGTSPIAFTYANLGAPGAVPIPASTQDGEIIVTSEAWPSGLFGDFDADCDVDIVDIMQVACRWQTSCDNPDPDDNDDTPNYAALYDVNDDCIIDLEDIMLVAAHWSETCP